jgi:hypothetical protein
MWFQTNCHYQSATSHLLGPWLVSAVPVRYRQEIASIGGILHQVECRWSRYLIRISLEGTGRGYRVTWSLACTSLKHSWRLYWWPKGKLHCLESSCYLKLPLAACFPEALFALPVLFKGLFIRKSSPPGKSVQQYEWYSKGYRSMSLQSMCFFLAQTISPWAYHWGSCHLLPRARDQWRLF